MKGIGHCRRMPIRFSSPAGYLYRATDALHRRDALNCRPKQQDQRHAQHDHNKRERQPQLPIVAEAITTRSQNQSIALVSDGRQKIASCPYCDCHQKGVRVVAKAVSKGNRDWGDDQNGGGIVQKRRRGHCDHHDHCKRAEDGQGASKLSEGAGNKIGTTGRTDGLADWDESAEHYHNRPVDSLVGFSERKGTEQNRQNDLPTTCEFPVMRASVM